VSGKKNRGFRHPDRNLNLLGHVRICTKMLMQSLDELRGDVKLCSFLSGN
jgi:hypothetical protein